MHELERIVVKDWGRLEPQDVDVRGAVAILGPTGAGKSTVVDAIQVVVTGANSRYYDLNKSTGGRNARSIRDYCLGADDHISPGRPKREAAETLIALAFRDRLSGEPLTVGLLLTADEADTRHVVRARFVAPGLALSVVRLIEERADGKRFFPSHARVLERLKQLCPAIQLHATATAYVDHYLSAMRRRGAAPDAGQVLRNFQEAIAFEPIDDPTGFVRKHILEQDDVDVDALRGSIERYRFLEEEVRRRERQLEEIGEARRRLQTWALHTINYNALRYVAAHAERRRADLVLSRTAERRAIVTREIEREQRAEERAKEQIRALEEDELRLRRLLAEAPGATKIAGLDAERRAAEAARGIARAESVRRLAQLSKLTQLAQRRDRVPIHLHDALDAIAELADRTRGRSPDALAAQDGELAGLERRSVALLGALGSLERQAEAVAADVHRLREQAGELEATLRTGGDGLMLSPHVRILMDLLAREGIEATPLPHVVDVSDPSWSMALEMLMGAGREALIVPLHRVGDAFGILYENRRRDNLDRCRLVDLRKTARWRSNLPTGSIAEIVITESDDARAFIERQVGRYVRAETDCDLEALDNAVTKRGKTTQGMALRVYRDIVPLFGRTAQAEAARRARETYGELSERLKRALADRDALQAAVAAIAAAGEEPADLLASALAGTIDANNQLRSIEQARAGAQSPEAAELSARMAEIRRDIAGHQEDVRDDIAPRLKALREDDTRLQVEEGTARLAWARHLEEEERHERAEAEPPISRLLTVVAVEDTVERARNRVAVAVEMPPAAKDPAALLADFAAEARRTADILPRLAEESARRGRGAWNQFVQAHMGASPIADPDDVAMLEWAHMRERQLEEDELRRFRAEFEEARRRMEADLTEGLINRLSDKFRKARAQIQRLNRSLAGRRFTGQTYAFDIRLNDALKPIHALAEAVGGASQKGLFVLEDAQVDPRARAGLKELERRLSDPELVKELRDYRRFFDFELRMVNERGEETTLSRRSQTGSGGQKQAPYYVAVGAAMASAYFPKAGIGEPDGVGLIAFDEAFNNLDAPNTRALLAFFADLHLQVIVAAPDKVRAMFLETADTIVSVNRRPSDQEPVVTVTHPTRLARQTLAGSNPVNKGVEHYRPIEQAAE